MKVETAHFVEELPPIGSMPGEDRVNNACDNLSGSINTFMADYNIQAEDIISESSLVYDGVLITRIFYKIND